MTKKAYTLDEVTEVTGIGRRSLDGYIARGELVARYVGERGGNVRILEVDLDNFLASLPTRRPSREAS